MYITLNLARAIELRVSYVRDLCSISQYHGETNFQKANVTPSHLCHHKRKVGCITSILRRLQQQRDCRDNKEVTICLYSSTPKKKHNEVLYCYLPSFYGIVDLCECLHSNITCCWPYYRYVVCS